VQQPGFVRKRINHWMSRLMGRTSSKSREGGEPELAAGAGGAGMDMGSSQSYTVVAGEAEGRLAGSDLGTVHEVSGAHVGPTSFPLGPQQLRVSQESEQSGYGLKPAASTFSSAGEPKW